MAAVAVSRPFEQGVVGIHYAPTSQDLQLSNAALKNDSEQPQVPEDILKALAEIFIRHGVHKLYGIHLVHSHSKAPSDTVMIGSTGEPNGKNICWTRPVAIADLDKPIHGHIYVLNAGNFVPYEYRTGNLVSSYTDVGHAFFKELADFLSSHGLSDLLGLEVLDRAEDPWCGEYILGDQGTVMVEKKDMNYYKSFRKTQFVFDLNENQEPDPVRCGTTHAETTYQTHRVFVSTPINNMDDVISVLREQDII